MRDLGAYLAGRWSAVGSGSDKLSGSAFVLNGEARFAFDGIGLVYELSGECATPAGRYEVRRRLVYRFGADGTAAVFDERGGELFVLDLSSGRSRVLHRCGPDRYWVTHLALSPAEFLVRWRAAGPDKCYSTETRYRRHHEGAPGATATSCT